MASEPFNWNVIVAGAWNTAILTPDGIRKRLFDLPDGTPIEVEVAIDRPGWFRVVHDGLLVTPSRQTLEITPQTITASNLRRATQIAHKALQDLPETPVAAVGINIRYRFSVFPDELIGLIRAPLDDVLADDEYATEGSSTRRSLTLTPGLINLEITQSDSNVVTLNFHRASTTPSDLREWLGRCDEFLEKAHKLFQTIRTDPNPKEATGEG